METATGQFLHAVKNGDFKSITYYSNNPLDRQSELRKDEKFISQSIESEKARFLLFNEQKPLAEEVADGSTGNPKDIFYTLNEKFCLKTLKLADVKRMIPEFGKNLEAPLTIYLGFGAGDRGIEQEEKFQTDGGTDKGDGYFWFAIDVTKSNIIDKITQLYPNSFFCRTRGDLLLLNESDAGITAQARSILAWHERYSYCPTCGSKTTVQDAGYKRWCNDNSCPSREGVHNTCFPRVDPAVIMVISSFDGERLLLGRKKSFHPSLYSCLAGFMEPGETVEETVRREVKEESGIVVGKVEYKFSQPWPYPAVIMMGCFGQALSEEITVCTEELEDVKWFDKASVYDALTKTLSSDGRLNIPPAQTIAHQLLRHWCTENGLIPAVSKM